MYLLWLLNNLNTWRASAVLHTVGLSAFVSELCQSRSQWLLQRNLILICWNRQANPPGCRGPNDAAHPCSSTAVIQPDLHTPHPPSLGYTYRGIEVGLGCSGLKFLKPPETLLVCWYSMSSSGVPLELRFGSWCAQQLLLWTVMSLVNKELPSCPEWEAGAGQWSPPVPMGNTSNPWHASKAILAQSCGERCFFACFFALKSMCYHFLPTLFL